MINVTENEFQELVDQFYKGTLGMSIKELMDNYNIVLEELPTHSNEEINKLINNFCTSLEKREGQTLYRGSATKYLGFSRYLTEDFEPMNKAFNGYREVYYSKPNLCSVTTVEGDVIIVLFDNIEAYEKGYQESNKFYDEY